MDKFKTISFNKVPFFNDDIQEWEILPADIIIHSNGDVDVAYYRDRKVPEKVDHPSHYNQGGIECIDAMISAYGKESVATFCKLNAFKYLWRADHKNGIEDMKKADWYVDKYNELMEK